MIASTKPKKESSWDDYSSAIWFELESGKVTQIVCVEYSVYGQVPKFKFDPNGDLMEIETHGETLRLNAEGLKNFKEEVLQKVEEFKKEHLS